MNVLFPNSNSPMSVILDSIKRALVPVISQNEASPRLLLRSPNGTAYAVTVNDAGTISTAVVDGNTRP